jgi:16S rRNA (cytosine967-C5)-methyltransferase
MACQKAEGAGTVFSYDLSKRKTDLIRSGAKRLHLDNIQIAERDAREFFKEDKDRADVILCDLPCSGLGVLGKKRDIKYRASMEGLSSLQQLQREILTNAVRYLKSGGVLIYSTCTINRAENEENAAWIAGKLGMQPDALAPYMPEGIPGIQDNMLQLLPHIHGTDGFFIARFRKK